MAHSMQNPLKVFLADDSRITRDRVAAVLAAAQSLAVGCFDKSTGFDQLASAVASSRPDATS